MTEVNSATIKDPNVYQEWVKARWFGNNNQALTENDTGLPALFIMTAGIGGEAGEVQELLKKYVRDGVLDTSALEKELGDVLYYLTRIAAEFNLTLSGIMQTNYKKLIDRDARGVLRGSGNDR